MMTELHMSKLGLAITELVKAREEYELEGVPPSDLDDLAKELQEADTNFNQLLLQTLTDFKGTPEATVHGLHLHSVEVQVSQLRDERWDVLVEAAKLLLEKDVDCKAQHVELRLK